MTYFRVDWECWMFDLRPRVVKKTWEFLYYPLRLFLSIRHRICELRWFLRILKQPNEGLFRTQSHRILCKNPTCLLVRLSCSCNQKSLHSEYLWVQRQHHCPYYQLWFLCLVRSDGLWLFRWDRALPMNWIDLEVEWLNLYMVGRWFLLRFYPNDRLFSFLVHFLLKINLKKKVKMWIKLYRRTWFWKDWNQVCRLFRNPMTSNTKQPNKLTKVA